MPEFREIERVVALARLEGSSTYSRAGKNGNGPRAAETYTMPRSTQLVETLLRSWGFDPASGNPLGSIIPRGSKIVVKPNWVYHVSRRHGSLESLITHTTIILAVLDYLARTEPHSVVIGDAPIQGCDFLKLDAAAGFSELRAWASKQLFPVVIRDFRRTVSAAARPDRVRTTEARPLSEFVELDLADKSLFSELDRSRPQYRVTAYDPEILGRTHNGGHHRYLIAREVLDADVIVNMPKLKCHSKAGITGALKNLVGINGHKEFLPHHRKGGAASGGDCYDGEPVWKRWAEAGLDTANGVGKWRGLRTGIGWTVSALRKIVEVTDGDDNIEGAWFGNDTVWRMCLDLNRIVLYGDRRGNLQPHAQRTVVNITDAIVAGEGDGPLMADPVDAGFLTGSLNGAAADYVHARLIGFDPMLIPIVREAFRSDRFPLADFNCQEVLVQENSTRVPAVRLTPIRKFIPPAGWRGRCELVDDVAHAADLVRI